MQRERQRATEGKSKRQRKIRIKGNLSRMVEY